MIWKNSLKIFSVTILTLTLIPMASAHRPLWEAEASIVTRIPDLTTSFAVYRDLTSTDQVDLYTFTAQAGDELYGGINIPAINGLEEYGVMVALVGPGLPQDGLDALPIDHPEDAGVLFFESEVSEDFFEPFTQTNYWGRQKIEMPLPEDGTYYLMVWHPEGQAGKYVMDVGRAEVFGPADLFRFPIWWVRVHAYFGHTPHMIAGALGFIGLLAVLIVKPWKRQIDLTSSEMTPDPTAIK